MSPVVLQGYSKHEGLTKNHSFRTMSFIARHASSNSTLLTCLCLCDSLDTRCSSEPLVLARPAAGLFPPWSIRTNRCAFGLKGFVICAETQLGLCSSQPVEEKVPLGNKAHPTCSKSGDTPFHRVWPFLIRCTFMNFLTGKLCLWMNVERGQPLRKSRSQPREGGWKNKEMRELSVRGRFPHGACGGKTQCMTAAKAEGWDPSGWTARRNSETWTVLLLWEGLSVVNLQTCSPAECICKAAIASLGLPLNISKGRERNTKGKCISESGAALPYGMPKEPPFPSYNRNKSVWSPPLLLLLLSAVKLPPPPPPSPQPSETCGGLQIRRDK